MTISSSSDDDDCILLSEPSSGDEGEPVDDPTNSGMHTNDLYNIPDEQGRVLVNVGRPTEEPEVFLAPQIARVIKPHQVCKVFNDIPDYKYIIQILYFSEHYCHLFVCFGVLTLVSIYEYCSCVVVFLNVFFPYR